MSTDDDMIVPRFTISCRRGIVAYLNMGMEERVCTPAGLPSSLCEAGAVAPLRDREL